MNGADTHIDIDARLRTMRILWAVFLTSVGLYALIAYVVDAPSTRNSSPPGPAGGAPETGEFSTLFLVLFAVAVSTVVASFLLKQSFTQRAVREQKPGLVQTALVVAAALCEMAGLLGLVGIFAEGNRYAYLLFVVAAAGLVLHFPRREDLLAASGGGQEPGLRIS